MELNRIDFLFLLEGAESYSLNKVVETPSLIFRSYSYILVQGLEGNVSNSSRMIPDAILFLISFISQIKGPQTSRSICSTED